MMVKLISLTILLVIQVVVVPTAQAYDYFTNCIGSPTYTNKSTYQTNLNNLLVTLTSQASSTGFNYTSVGQFPDQVYGLYLCRGDMNSQGCSQCVNQAHTSILQQCPSQKRAVIWYDDCTLRFSNLSFLHRMDYAPSNPAWNPQNVSSNETQIFLKVLSSTMTDLTSQVANSTIKYGTRVANLTSSQNLYTLGQCTPDLTSNDCDRCLRIAIAQLPHTFGARVLQPSCNVRYEFATFYSNTTNFSFFLPATNSSSSGQSPKEKHKRSSHTALAVSIPIVLVVLLLSGAFCYVRNRKRAKFTTELHEISNARSLQIDYKKLRTATDDFSENNKLGQGGFGIVYKGRLENGQDIAVKRLSTSSGQGVKEFKTEIVLVAKLHHKNLVRLLGFCLHAEEKLLVYEFLPNSSLDKVLLDRGQQQTLHWETRYNIIAGIARGLLYLHEDSRLKIIHRDLKSSNILLDESMNPKISDFGLAKLVGADQIHAGTNRILGTYGYMAPEYAMTGQFSVKSDVYSFGIIVLEIITGHKCNSTAFPYHEESLIERAWSMWNTNAALEMADPRLDGFVSEEVVRCMHIALLCIQEDANKRPTMTPIVSALNGHYVDLPVPSPPQLVTTNSSSQTSNTISGSKYITDVHPR